jgi:hypothetical protein
MFVVLAGNLAGTPGVSTIVIDGNGPIPASFAVTAVLGTAPTFFEAFDLATGGALTTA